MDMQQKAKLSVLEDLIATMKEKENEGFKSKSSKFFPEQEKEDVPEDMSSMEEVSEPSIPMDNDEEEDDDIERLKAIYSKLK